MIVIILSCFYLNSVDRKNTFTFGRKCKIKVYEKNVLAFKGKRKDVLVETQVHFTSNALAF